MRRYILARIGFEYLAFALRAHIEAAEILECDALARFFGHLNS